MGTSLGELYKIRVGLHEQTPKFGWFLDRVKMQEASTNETLVFKVHRWMSHDQDDHDVWRELPVVRPGQEPLPGTPP